MNDRFHRSRSKMNEFPVFKKDKRIQNLIRAEMDTSKLIRSLWEHADHKSRSDVRFIELLIKLGWCNRGSSSALRIWRDNNIKEFLRISSKSTEDAFLEVLA